MRCSEDEERDEDEYPAGYYSDGIGTSTTQWSIYAASQSHAQGSSSRQHTGYDGPSGTWLTENSYNPQAGGGYVGQSIHASQQNMGYDAAVALRSRQSNQWPTDAPSRIYTAGRQSMDFTSSSPSTSISQALMDPRHNSDREVSYTPQISSSQHPSPSSGYGAPEVHNYAPLPSTPQAKIESYLAPVKPPVYSAGTSTGPSSKRGAYQCIWPGCPKAARGEVFKSKDNARVHVHKHFGTDKLFECVVESCRKRFASEDAAKRHRDTTESKAFSCGICHKEFARKDYRDVHQKKCME